MIRLRYPGGAASSNASMVRRARRELTYTITPETSSAATGSAFNSQGICQCAPAHTSARLSATTPLEKISVLKWSASASSAWLSYLSAIFCSLRERHQPTRSEEHTSELQSHSFISI